MFLIFLKNPASFNRIVIQSQKHTIAGFRCTRQKLLFSLSMLSREPECGFTTIFDNKQGRLNDKYAGKCQ